MNLKAILPTYAERKYTPRITFYKDGYLGISNEAQERFNFKEGNRILLLQDSSNPQQFYIKVYKGEGTFPVLKKRKNGMLKCGYTSAFSLIAELFISGKGVSYSFDILPAVNTEYGITHPLEYRKEGA